MLLFVKIRRQTSSLHNNKPEYGSQEVNMKDMNQSKQLDSASENVRTHSSSLSPTRSVRFCHTTNTPAANTSPNQESQQLWRNRGDRIVGTKNPNVLHRDIGTGRRTTRHQSAQLVHHDDREARSRWTKMTSTRKLWQSTTTCASNSKREGLRYNSSIEEEENDDDDDEEQNGSTRNDDPMSAHNSTAQYRIRSHSQNAEDPRSQHQKQRRQYQRLGKHISQCCQNMVTDYLLWCFASSFWLVTLVSYAQFLSLVMMFALLIYWVGRVQPQCLTVASAGDFKEAGKD